MTDRNKFEQMLEALINEETEKAKEIFHDIVVAKSRDIYESLLDTDFAEDAETEETPVEEDGEEEVAVEEESDEEGADDAADDSEDDAADDEFGGDEEGEEEPFGDEEGDDSGMDDAEQTDRILDLEDALEELKAEFEQLMAGDEGGDDIGGDEFGGDATDDFMGDVEDEGMPMMEYVNQVGGKQYNQFGKMGDNGANTKSPVAGKNDMGGTTANIVKGGTSTTGGTKGGLLNPSTKEENFGNVNVPGGNAGKTGFKKKEPGHGAEKAGAGEKADNKRSIVGGK